MRDSEDTQREPQDRGNQERQQGQQQPGRDEEE